MNGVFAMLAGFVLPLWLLAGLADYLCHRRTAIATTSGWRESALHLLQWLQIAVPTVALLTLQFTPALLVLVIACLLAHALTAWWDERYAGGRREIMPVEHKIHGVLDVLPWSAAALVFCHVWFDRPELWNPRWLFAVRVALRDPAIEAVVGGGVLLALLPVIEEGWRGWCRRFDAPLG